MFYDRHRFIDEWILETFKNPKIAVETIVHRHEIFDIIKRHNIEVFYSGLPYHYKKDFFPNTVSVIGTIHGLRSIEQPIDTFTYKYFSGLDKIKKIIKKFCQSIEKHKEIRYMARCLEFLDKIICVSNHTRYAIAVYFPNCTKDIQVLYTPQKTSLDSRDVNSPFISGKYILLLSANRWEKNRYRALIALENLLSKGLLNEHKVIVVGKLTNSINNTIKQKDLLQCIDYVETSNLENLYKNCDIFLYPTLNEGFGMPPLEAMKYGKTCIVSAVCSLPEICGDAVYYVNPYDIEEIENRILQAVNCKISQNIISKHISKITLKQKTDLDALCKFILYKV